MVVPYQPPPKGEAPRVDWNEVIIPFKFFDLSRIEQLDPLDSEGHLMHIATGEFPPRERRPEEPFTAWVTMAHLGLIEEGGPLLKAELTREQRLEAAREVLTEDELVIVETIAVPKRYRSIPAQELVEMIRTAPDYIDRMWAACWLILVGWTEGAECTFRNDSEMPPNMCSELEETVVEAYAESIGVSSRDDVLGWRRVDESPEVLLASRRLTICETHYSLNGPPPYEHTKNTVPLAPGWKQVVQVVPENLR
jgi:hypothetical protein